MLFYSPIYLFLFLPFVIIFYFKSNLKYKKKLLIFFSAIFYSYWNIYFLPIIIFSIFTNYILAKKILNDPINKKNYLFLSILINILLLIIFKYLDFIILNINLLFGSDLSYLNIPFPLAISFFTFQSIAFMINCFDEEISNLNLTNYSLFIFFFPQLIAGPIVKYNNMVPQFNDEQKKIFNSKNFSIGFIILLIGFIKKVYLADSLSIFVDEGYNNVQNLDSFFSWVLSISFTMQFYFDFSGYVDMATGSALILNILLPKNFDSPLKSCSIIDFWRRWHITLSDFLTNYLYTPWLKSLKKITYLKSMILIIFVFLIAGLWHGPAWNFVIFGGLHGLGLVINHTYRKLTKLNLPKFLSWFMTFNFVNISFIFFRSEDIHIAFLIIKKMYNIIFFDINKFQLISDYLNFDKNTEFYIALLFSFSICFFFKNTNYLKEKAN